MIAGALILALGFASAPEAGESAPSPASGPATGPAVVLAPLHWEGEAQKSALRAVRERLDEEADDPEIAWVAAERVAKAVAEVGPCARDPACHRRLGERAGARFVVVPSVKLRDRVYQVSFQVVAVEDGEVVAQTSEFCEICGIQDVASMVAEQAATLRPQLLALLRGPPVLEVFTVPDAAEVLVDGRIVGISPLTLEVTAGRHLVRAQKEDRVAQERELLAVEGVTETLRIELPAMKEEPAPPVVTRPSTPRRVAPPADDTPPTSAVDRSDRAVAIFGYTAVGVGVASIAVGIPMQVLDGRQDRRRCSGDDVDVNGTCRYTWATGPVGTALLVSGGALVATGAVVLLARWRRSRSRDTARLRILPALGPTLGGAAVRF